MTKAALDFVQWFGDREGDPYVYVDDDEARQHFDLGRAYERAVTMAALRRLAPHSEVVAGCVEILQELER